MVYNWERAPTIVERHWKKAVAAILALAAAWLVWSIFPS